MSSWRFNGERCRSAVARRLSRPVPRRSSWRVCPESSGLAAGLASQPRGYRPAAGSARWPDGATAGQERHDAPRVQRCPGAAVSPSSAGARLMYRVGAGRRAALENSSSRLTAPALNWKPPSSSLPRSRRFPASETRKGTRSNSNRDARIAPQLRRAVSSGARRDTARSRRSELLEFPPLGAGIVEGRRATVTLTATHTVVHGGTALGLIRARFARLHGSALRAATRLSALEWLGEALHLLQDSFSSAHVERAGGTRPIRNIRAFFIRLGWPPLSRVPGEHNAPSDPGANHVFVGGAMRPEARAAVSASRAFLVMALRHLRAPSGSPTNVAELRAFIRL